jgi:hypothetical protein
MMAGGAAFWNISLPRRYKYDLTVSLTMVLSSI